MTIPGTQGADTLIGTPGDDIIYGLAGNDTISAGKGDDVLAGHEGNDTLLGGDGDDYLLGGPGNDTLDGGAGNDWAAYEDATAGVKVDLNLTGAQNTGGGGTDKLIGIENLYGSAFNDTLVGNAAANMLGGDAGNDTISGGKGDDTLVGGAGNDVLDGGDGDDYIIGGAGDDIIKGGAGVDWAAYEDATAGVTVDLTKAGAQDTGGAGKDTLSGVELLYGSKFGDTLTGDDKDNYLWGDDGDDKLYGGKGDDHLSGGKGVNIINGGDGVDTVDYSFSDKGVTINLQGSPPPQVPIPDGVDTIISVEAAMGSAHDDYIVGNAAENYLFGDAGNDVIFGIDGNDVLDGGDGNDILRGSFRKPGDLMLGGAGDDMIIAFTGPGSEGTTTVDGGSGVDSLHFASIYNITLDLRNTGDQVVAPGVHMIVQNVENVTGSQGADRLTGNAGANMINGGLGDDILDGGAGFDIASYEGDRAVRVDLSKTGPQDTVGAGIDTLSNFEGLRGSLRGDILIGDAKDNTLEGGFGDDILDGGAGKDTAIFWAASANYTWTRNADETWTVKGLEGVDTLLNIETLKFSDKSVTLSPSDTTVKVDDLWLSQNGSEAADTLIGTAHADKLSGYGGVDTIVGGKGADILTGGKGLDIFMFAPGDTTWSRESDVGADVITDWDASDRMSFWQGGGAYSEQTAATWSEAVEKAMTTRSDHGVLVAVQVVGDTYVFDTDNGKIQNVVKLAHATLDDISIDNFSWLGTSIYSFMGYAMHGNDEANILVGSAGDDVIDGMGGDDVIQGGWGVDTLIGGAGADVFKFLAYEGAYNHGLTFADVILDFGGNDKLAFANAPTLVKESDILRFDAVLDPDGKISAAAQLLIDGFNAQITAGAAKYLIVSAGADTYVIADNDPTHQGLDHVVLLKGVASSLVTPDFFA